MSSQRWCVHVPGPDDLYPMRSRAAAEALAAAHNRAIKPMIEKAHTNPNYPRPEAMTAVVIEYPHGNMTDEEWAAKVEELEACR